MAKKVLVAVYSASGATRRVGEEIARISGGDFFEIMPKEPYTSADLDWMNKKSRSSVEMNDPSARPEIVNAVPNMGDYDTVIIGFPMVVFATPLYYYGMTAQLKSVVDRFCAYNSSLNSRHLKSALLTVAWNADDWTFEALTAHYKTLVRYINFEDQGMILGYGCGTPAMTKRSRYPDQAYALGKNL